MFAMGVATKESILAAVKDFLHDKEGADMEVVRERAQATSLALQARCSAFIVSLKRPDHPIVDHAIQKLMADDILAILALEEHYGVKVDITFLMLVTTWSRSIGLPVGTEKKG